MKTALSLLTLMSWIVCAQDLGVSTQGTCNKRVVADRGQIIATAKEYSKAPKEARNKAAEKLEKFRTAVKKLNPPDLEFETVEAAVYPRYEWESNKNVFKGYMASYGLKVSSSAFEKLAEVLDIALDQGIKDVGQISSYLSRELIKKEEKSCLDSASKDAKEKAEALASSLGAHIGKVLRIVHSSDGGYSPMPMMAKAESFSGGGSRNASPTFDAGFRELQTSVSVTFELR